MHELSVAQRLVGVVQEELAGQQVRVTVVNLRLGPLSGVVAEALLFCFDIATADTILQGAKLEIEEVAPVVYCPECKQERELPSIQMQRCPVCHTPTPQVVRGRELEIVSLEVVDGTEDRPGPPAGA
jgi:hydrogenase nickel incorporation protein HypA/HybF